MFYIINSKILPICENKKQINVCERAQILGGCLANQILDVLFVLCQVNFARQHAKK